MKRNYTLRVTAATVLLGVTVTGASANTVWAAKSTDLIGAATAANIAKKAVGNHAQVKDVELERENGRIYYEVELQQGNKDWDIDVDAYTGKTIRSHSELNDDSNDKSIFNKPSHVTITEKQAGQIALKNVPGTLLSAKLDKDDGRFVYDVKVLTDEGTVELEIHATSGAIVNMDEDFDDNHYDDDHNVSLRP
ncbi:PepSY domain-containing protein [Paenibacillus farraposensis]|uniref:PepSY domain-containing protein n=1 Tax=Paenibacillus farraposensis TaxID=2807095 RepID=A0ABW4D916_9BACL|nr:PepSY domain-containing protein [Paenibacillus farraposensis]MCC3381681.1 PepSY domain-containing protein [Paenibacillus farraposensis]